MLGEDDLLGSPTNKPVHDISKPQKESFINQVNSLGMGNLIDFDYVDNKKLIKMNQTSVIDVDFY